jgi:hypothetical protein
MPEQKLAPLEMRIKWIYGIPDPPRLSGYKRADLRTLATHRMIADRFKGKSALGEFLFSKYVTDSQMPASGYDFYAAEDLESLTQLDKECPYHKNVTLVHGSNVKLRCNYQTMRMKDLDPSKSRPGQVFITCAAFYLNDYERYAALLHFTKLLRFRAQMGWDHISVLFIREAQEYVQSQIKTNQARSQKEAGDDFIKFHNQAYHSGVAVILDSQRDVEVAKNVRELNTFRYFKNMGAMEIPESIHWIRSESKAEFNLESLKYLRNDQFLIITNQSSVGLGTFQMPPWHINRGDPLLQKYNITITDNENKDVDYFSNLAHQENVTFDRENPERSHAGRKSLISMDQEIGIQKMLSEGKRPRAIFEELCKTGFTGTERTLRDHVRRIEILQKVNTQTS